jgi:hypothetical protein
MGTAFYRGAISTSGDGPPYASLAVQACQELALCAGRRLIVWRRARVPTLRSRRQASSSSLCESLTQAVLDGQSV